MDINKLFQDALLARAAYASLEGGFSSQDLIRELLKLDDMTQAQAELIASTYKVIAQDEQEGSGFSATLFQNIETGEYHLAMRGSQEPWVEPVDWRANILQNGQYGMSFDQVADMLNFYLRLTHTGDVPQFKFSAVPELEEGQEGVRVDEFVYLVLVNNGIAQGYNSDITPQTPLSTSGHSLGGHLASIFTLLLPTVITNTTTFDSAGIVGEMVNEFLDVMASVVTDNGVMSLVPTYSNVNNVDDISAPLDPVSGIPFSDHLSGNLVDVFIENGSIGLANHEMDKLVDSLAVINFMHSLDNNVTIDIANQLLNGSSNEMNTSLERVMNNFSRLFGQAEIAITDSNHDAIYSVIKNITDTLGEGVYNLSLVDSSTLNQAISGDKASIYALLNLQPFVLSGGNDLYSNLDTALYSEQFLQDRAAMLERIIYLNTEDLNYDIDAVYLNGGANPYEGDEFYFNDKKSQIIIDQSNLNNDFVLDVNQKHIVFGSSGDDTDIEGFNKADHLYGMGGNDILTGGEGNDYLEGGTGNDTYQWALGDGNDVIEGKLDTELDKILVQVGETSYDIGTLSLSKYPGQSIYDVDNNDAIEKLTFDTASQTLTIYMHNAAGGSYETITVNNFEDGDFGITLAAVAPAPLDPLIEFGAGIANPNASVEDARAISSEINGSGRNLMPVGVGITYDAETYYTNQYFQNVDTETNSNNVPLGPMLRNYQFDGTNFDDVLIGSDWRALQTLAVGGVHQTEDLILLLKDDAGYWGDILSGKDGDDLIVADKSQLDDSLEKPEDSNILMGGRGSDIVIGGAGTDIIMGADSYSSYFNSESYAELAARGGDTEQVDHLDVEHVGDSDALSGGAGDDTLVAGSYNDFLEGGEGNDILLGGVGQDILTGGAGSDTLLGDSNFILQFFVNSSGETEYTEDASLISPGDNNEDLAYDPMEVGFNNFDLDYNDVLSGGAGIDYIYGEIGHDVLLGGDGDDWLMGDRVNHPQMLPDGFGGYNELPAVAIIGGNTVQVHGDDKLYGGAGLDHLFGGGGDDLLYGGEGDDQLFGDDEILDKQYHGNDTIYGGAGNDYIDGGSGDDTIYGGEGNDTLRVTGGDQNTLDGGEGDDVYVVSGGDATIVWDGQDTVLSEGNAEIHLASSVNLDTLTWAESANHIVLFNNTGSTLALDKQLVSSLVLSTGDGPEAAQTVLSFMTGNSDKQVFFNPASPPQLTTLSDVGLVASTEGIGGQQPILYSENQKSEFLGTEEADIMVSLSGDHQIYSGLGSDQIMTGAGNNMIYTGTGDDSIISSGSDNVLVLDEGAKTLQLSAGMGKSRVYFSSNDTRLDLELKDVFVNQLTAVVYGDLLALHLSESSDNYVLLALADVPLVTLKSNDGGLSLSDALSNSENYWVDETHTEVPVPNGILLLSNSDVFVLPDEALEVYKGFVVNGTEEIDVLSGGFLSENINGYGGDDIILAQEGDDIIAGGDGDDFIDVGRGRDVVRVENGEDTIVLREGYGENITILDGGYGDELGLVLDVSTFDRANVYTSINVLGNTLIHLNANDSIEIRYVRNADVSLVRLNFADETGVSLNHFIDEVYSIEDIDADGMVEGDESNNLYVDDNGITQFLARGGNDIVEIDAATHSISSINVSAYDSVERINVQSVANLLMLTGSSDDHIIDANGHSVIYQYDASNGGVDTIIGATNVTVNLNASSDEFSTMTSYLDDGLWVYDFGNDNKLQVESSAKVTFNAQGVSSASSFFAYAPGAEELQSQELFTTLAWVDDGYNPVGMYSVLADQSGYDVLILTGKTEHWALPRDVELVRVGDDLNVIYSNEYQSKYEYANFIVPADDFNETGIYREMIQGSNNLALRQVRINGFFSDDNETITEHHSEWRTGTRQIQTWTPSGGATSAEGNDSGVISSDYGGTVNLVGPDWSLVTIYEEYTYFDEWTTSSNQGGFVESIGSLEFNLSTGNLPRFLMYRGEYDTYDENTAPELFFNSFYISYDEIATDYGIELDGNVLSLINYDADGMVWGEDNEGDIVSFANITEGSNISSASFSYDRVMLEVRDVSQTVSFNYQLTDGELLSDIGSFVVFDGTASNFLKGTNEDDFIDAKSNNDVIYGLSGDDTLIGGTGNDQLVGGDGSDTYIYEAGDGSDTINNEDTDFGYDQLLIKSGHGIKSIDDNVVITFDDDSDVTISFDGLSQYIMEHFFIRDNNDLIVNLPSSETILLSDYFSDENYAVDEIIFEIDIYYLGQFDATSSYSFLADEVISVLGSIGVDLSENIEGSNQGDTIITGSGNDVINGLNGADVIVSGAGDDMVDGGNGRDIIDGGLGDDTLFGGSHKDQITGGAGDDEIHGGRGQDIIDGGLGNDTLFGGSHKDQITGGAGDDEIHGGRGQDIIDGGLGNDTLFGGSHKDQITGGAGDDEIHGGIRLLGGQAMMKFMVVEVKILLMVA